MRICTTEANNQQEIVMIRIDGIEYKTIEDAASVLLIAKRVEIYNLPMVKK